MEWPEPVSTVTLKSGGGTGKYVSLNAVADRWACDRSTVRRNLERAGVKAFCLGHGKHGIVRYLLKDVEDYERRCREPSKQILARVREGKRPGLVKPGRLRFDTKASRGKIDIAYELIGNQGGVVLTANLWAVAHHRADRRNSCWTINEPFDAMSDQV